MNWRSMILSAFLCAGTLLAAAQQADNDRILLRTIDSFGQAEVSIAYPGRQEADLIGRNLSVSDIREGRMFIRLSPSTVNWFLERGYSYTIEKLFTPEDFRGMKGLGDWDTYPSYTQYDSMMRSYTLLYPSLCRLDTVGTSINGKLVLVLKISDNAGTDEDEPEVFFTSTIHGDETGGFVLMLRFIDYLLKNTTGNQRVKKLVEGLEIWINPLANPDGTYRTGNTITSPVRSNSAGVDLNRNFPDPFLSGAVRQKETTDMMKFMEERRFVLSANFHSGEEIVNYPWDRWLGKLHADNEWFRQISRAYADTVHKYSSPAYMNGFDNGIVRGAVWYVIYGGRQDYVTWELQGREVTIELDQSYVTPPSQLPLLWQNNYRSFITYLENALFGIQGKVLDAEDSTPVPARIFIAGHDADSSHVYSDTLTGSFVRMLAPGSWDLTFTASGYRDTTIRGVTVALRQKTDIQVFMNPASTPADSSVPGRVVLYPNPAAGDIKAELPDAMAGIVDIRIWNSSGILIADYADSFLPGSFIVIGSGRYTPGNYIVRFSGRQNGMTVTGKFTIVR